MFAAFIYNQLPNNKAQTYEMCKADYDNKKDKIVLKSPMLSFIKVFEELDKTSERYISYLNKMAEQILIDFSMANWDAYSNYNSILNDSDDNIFRVDVGGSLYYRGLGDRNILFNTSNPHDHLTFNSPGFRELIDHIKKSEKIKDIIEQNIKNLKKALDTINALNKINALDNINNPIVIINKFTNPEIATEYTSFATNIYISLIKRMGFYIKNGKAILKKIFGLPTEIGGKNRKKRSHIGGEPIVGEPIVGEPIVIKDKVFISNMDNTLVENSVDIFNAFINSK
jgi:hypothetical protein